MEIGLENVGVAIMRHKTKYPGVYYRISRRIGGKGDERVYYIVFKKEGRTIEEKVGRQYADQMTPSQASIIRSDRIEGKRMSPKERRKKAEEEKKIIEDRWTIERLWDEYKRNKLDLKGLVTDENRYKNHIAPYFGNKEASEILPLDVDRVRIKLLKIRSQSTVRNVLELLRRIVNFGSDKNLCKGFQFQFKIPKVSNIKTEDLTPQEIVCLLDVIEDEIKFGGNIIAANMMRMALYTGMRRGEMFRLKWEHIDYNRGFISLKNPKGGVDQEIPLNEGAREVLVTHKEFIDSEFVFPGRDGRQRTDINKAVNRIKKKAGIGDNFRALQGLRHVYASTLASSGLVDLYTLQRLLTHKSPTMTQRYAHLRDDALKGAAAIASDLINGNRTKD